MRQARIVATLCLVAPACGESDFTGPVTVGPDMRPEGVLSDRIEVDGGPNAVAVSSRGAVYIVTNTADVARGRVPLENIVGAVAVGVAPVDVAFSPSGQRAIVVNRGASSVSLIDAVAHDEYARVAFPVFPNRALIHPDGSRAYVATQTDSLYVIDLGLGRITGALFVAPDARGLALSADGDLAYVPSRSGNILELDLSTGAILRTFGMGSGGLADVVVTPDGGFLFAALEDAGVVRRVDLGSGTSTASITLPAGMRPARLALTPDGRDLYVPGGAGSGLVAIVDTDAAEVRATLVTEGDALGAAFTTDGSTGFVVNGAGWVDVVR